MPVLQLPLNTISHQELQHVISPEQALNTSLLACSFSGEQLTLTKTELNQSTVELVVLGDITIACLQAIIHQCQLTTPVLTAINFRNDRYSYRFKVICHELQAARQMLANLALTHSFDAALIDNAPKLALPGLLVMDMDSTTIKIECIDEIATLAGVGEQVAEVTELAMQGELDFAQSLHQRVATLANAPETILATVAKNIPLMEGLETLVTILKQHNWRIAIASGGFTYFAEHLQQMLALDDVRANVLEINNGVLTGKVLGDVVDAQAKANCLVELQKQYQLSPQQTVAMGDGANDLIMMNAASLGVAFHAKPLVLKQADCAINYNGLDCLLHWLA
ncbi:phosphoserine phosphatase SerB [Thalassotalea piscium]